MRLLCTAEAFQIGDLGSQSLFCHAEREQRLRCGAISISQTRSDEMDRTHKVIPAVSCDTPRDLKRPRQALAEHDG